MRSRLARAVDLVLPIIILVLLVAVSMVILTRRLNLSWAWLHDIARWSQIWMVFLGTVVLTWYNDHIAVDVIQEKLPEKFRAIAYRINVLLTIAVAAVLLYYGSQEVQRMVAHNERSMSGRLPAFVGYMVVPLSMALVILSGIRNFIRGADSTTSAPAAEEGE